MIPRVTEDECQLDTVNFFYFKRNKLLIHWIKKESWGSPGKDIQKKWGCRLSCSWVLLYSILRKQSAGNQIPLYFRTEAPAFQIQLLSNSTIMLVSVSPPPPLNPACNIFLLLAPVLFIYWEEGIKFWNSCLKEEIFIGCNTLQPRPKILFRL